MNMSDVNYSIENSLRPNGNEVIIGVDEVGRGPWAGPVTACAVVLDPDNIPLGLNDSKKLNAKRRAILFEEIMGTSLVSYVHVDVGEIDKINILQATFRAMERAVSKLPIPDHILIDGNKLPPNITLSNETSLEDAMKALVEAKKDSVIVVKDDKKLGSVSMYDIVHAATRSSETAGEAVTYR